MFLALDGVLFFAVLALWLFCIFDVITTDASLVRNMPKGFWILIVLILPDVGSVLWLIAGRPRAAARPGGLPYKGNAGRPASSPSRGASRRGPVAPDDDPEFLARLDRDTLRAWEDDLRRREQKLRDSDAPGEPGTDAPPDGR
ncbi:MAG TPA: PLD nuclease N-terminal domain-containing protein [Mycobacteriales bacterium]|nr:PLD nuclease N-terminal domain-containing protein [Mycobacteriales bacterium]